MTRVRWVVVSIGVLLALLGIVFVSALGSNSFDATNASTGHPAPEFSLPRLGGGTVSLAENAGKVTVVNYWNDWCIPCQDELSDLKDLSAAHKDDPRFAMVGIVHDERSRADIVDYAKKHKIAWPIAFDPEASTALDYAVTGQPETFVIDKAGIVQTWIKGPIDPAKLEALVQRLEAA